MLMHGTLFGLFQGYEKPCCVDRILLAQECGSTRCLARLILRCLAGNLQINFRPGQLTILYSPGPFAFVVVTVAKEPRGCTVPCEHCGTFVWTSLQFKPWPARVLCECQCEKLHSGYRIDITVKRGKLWYSRIHYRTLNRAGVTRCLCSHISPIILLLTQTE